MLTKYLESCYFQIAITFGRPNISWITIEWLGLVSLNLDWFIITSRWLLPILRSTGKLSRSWWDLMQTPVWSIYRDLRALVCLNLCPWVLKLIRLVITRRWTLFMFWSTIQRSMSCWRLQNLKNIQYSVFLDHKGIWMISSQPYRIWP